MLFFYLAIGVALTFLLHAAIRHIQSKEEQQPGYISRWLKRGGLLALILLLLRMSAARLFAIYSWVLLLLPFWSRYRQGRQSSPRDGRGNRSGTDGMSADEARMILGVSAHASRAQIKQAHHELMRKLHPDVGGTDYFARKLNEARDVLLRVSDSE